MSIDFIVNIFLELFFFQVVELVELVVDGGVGLRDVRLAFSPFVNEVKCQERNDLKEN